MCIRSQLFKGISAKPFVSKHPNLRRKKVWELEHRFHCSIAGTCFDLDEMRKFCRKSKVKVNGPVMDYELHTSFVGILGNAHAARPAVKYLDRKYKASIERFNSAENDAELKALWKESVSIGEIGGAFWALVTHPRTSAKLLYQVYGEVHMLSHLSGANIRIDLQALARLRHRVPKLEQELAISRTAQLHISRKKDGIIEGLNKRLNQALASESKLQIAEEKLQLLESNDMLRHLRDQVRSYAEKLEHSTVRAERAEAQVLEKNELLDEIRKQNSNLKEGMMQLTAERNALESTLENALSNECGSCENSDTCKQKFNLEGQRILYVGGRNRLCTHFRTLVEQQNGEFIHHDGGREESTQRLDALLTKVDAVLCPIDCISHDAVARIKRDCKRYGKHFTLLPKSSLSAFTKGIFEFSNTTALAS